MGGAYRSDTEEGRKHNGPMAPENCLYKTTTQTSGSLPAWRNAGSPSRLPTNTGYSFCSHPYWTMQRLLFFCKRRRVTVTGQAEHFENWISMPLRFIEHLVSNMQGKPLMWRSAEKASRSSRGGALFRGAPSSRPQVGRSQSVRPGVARLLEVWLATKTKNPPKGPAAPLVDWLAGWLASRLDDLRGSLNVHRTGRWRWLWWLLLRGGAGAELLFSPVSSYNSSCPSSSSPSDSCSPSSMSSKSWGAEEVGVGGGGGLTWEGLIVFEAFCINSEDVVVCERVMSLNWAASACQESPACCPSWRGVGNLQRLYMKSTLSSILKVLSAWRYCASFDSDLRGN